MKPLPSATTYEQEFVYMPWKRLIEKVLDYIVSTAPQNASVLDLMCGPGYLLGQIEKKRSDLQLEGVDISADFINHARAAYPNVSFTLDDVLSWEHKKQYDLVLITAGLHHLPSNEQTRFLPRLSNMINPNGAVILADPYIEEYRTEQERKLAAAKLGYEYLCATIRLDAPDEIVKAALDIAHNDVLGFEFKTSLDRMTITLEKLFRRIEIHKTWPLEESKDGDYYLVMQMPKELHIP